MAYYDALIAKWGTLAPDTTANKLAALNAQTVTGAIPTSFFTTGDALLNCINYTEFQLLTAQEKLDLFSVIHTPGQLLGGSAQTSHMAAGIIVDLFLTKHAGPTTIANLTALAKATTLPWWQANGYSQPIGTADLTLAGGLT